MLVRDDAHRDAGARRLSEELGDPHRWRDADLSVEYRLWDWTMVI
jgi:hypothetical protein